MNFGVTMSSTIKIFPKHTELPYFIKAAELLAETIAAYFSRGLIQRFQRTQFLAIGLGYENYPDLAFRAQNTPGDAETLLFFQDKEQNNRIAQTFTDNVSDLGVLKGSIASIVFGIADRFGLGLREDTVKKNPNIKN